MRFDRFLSAVEAAILAFFISFAGCAGLITAFELEPVELGVVALWCAIGAVVFAIAFSFRYLCVLPLGAAALYAGYLWRQGVLPISIEAVARQLSVVYNRAYGWDVVLWSAEDITEVGMTPAICVLGILIAIFVTLTVCRRITVIPAVFVSLLPLTACLVVTDILPDMICLYTLLLGLLVLILSQTVRRLNIAHGNILTALVAAPAALALLALFLAVPEKGYRMPDSIDMLFSWVDAVTNRDGGTGNYLGFDVASVGSVDLDQVGVRVNKHTAVMDVTADYSGVIYLRGRAYDTYRGLTWESTSQAEALYWPSESILIPAGELTFTTRSVHQDVYLPYYSETHYTSKVTQHISNWEKERTFTHTYMVLPENYADMEVTRPGGSFGGEFVQLPASTRQWAQTLLPEILRDRSSAIQIANDIGSYVRASARYSTWTRRMPVGQEDFARWFLTDSSTGYCIHFATAATVLLRAAGIPARYVTGYMVTTTAGKTTVVREENAHAWVEYWVRGIGWIILEATPSMEQSPNPSGTTVPTVEPLQPEATLPETTVPTRPEPSAATTQPSTAPSQSTDPALGPGNGSAGGTPLDLGWLWGILKTLGWLLLTLGILLGQWLLRLRLRRQKLTRGSVNTQALTRWRYALFLARLLKEPPGATLHGLAQKAKFSQHTLSREELRAFDAYIRDALARLQKKPLPCRLFYRLVLALY